MFTLSNNELLIFQSLCYKHQSVDELVTASGLSSKTVYRLTSSLTSKGLIVRLTRGKGFLPAASLHGVALRNYAISNQHSLDAISGSRLLILLSLIQSPKGMNRIALETRLRQETVRTLSWRLRRIGVVSHAINGALQVSPTDTAIVRFLTDFSKGASIHIMQKKSKEAAMIWSGGLELIFSADAVDDHEGVERTAPSAMCDFGVPLLSAGRDYYYHAHWNPKLRPEDVALHSILIDPGSTRAAAYSILLLKKAGFDQAYLMEEAKRLGMGDVAKDMVRLLSGRGGVGPRMPTMSDLEDLYRLYGVG